MGVPKFFRWISERYPCLSEIVKEYQIPEFDNLYLDMNGIIHNCSHPNDFDPHFRISEEKIFKDIFHYIEVLFRMIRPKKLFFMAVDGVAPRAKMNQQRGRRFRSAKEAEILERRAQERGERLPPEARFDSNCITPGTVFMDRLHQQLKFFVAYKISTDSLWQDVTVILSGHETPGEGEHKIMDYIRYAKSRPDHDPNTRHCLYGLDADLIMLGLCSHEPHFSLLREEVKFGRKNQKQRTVAPEETTFYLLHLSLMREYLEHEFSELKEKLPFPFDLEKIIDDWVLMGFLVGNDFIPPLPDMHITSGALPMLYRAYIEVLPQLGGYINEGGELNLKRFEHYMQRLATFDFDQFRDTYADLREFEIRTGRRPGNERKSYRPEETEGSVNSSPRKNMDPELSDLISRTVDMLAELDAIELTTDDDDEYSTQDSDEEEKLFLQEFDLHKRDYYINKLEYEAVTPEVMQTQAEGYVRAIQWNLHYYYNGVCSWSWYYPHHYAPYVSDVKDFSSRLKLEYDLGKPFLPFQQLLAVLPSLSKTLLPVAYQHLMDDEKSPLISYYPKDFKTDLNGKKQEWEAVVLIPFIKERDLLQAMDPCETNLTEEERTRNSHGPMLVYKYTDEDLGEYVAPEYFPSLQKNHAKVIEIWRDDLNVEKKDLVKGLCSGVMLDVYFPGFPTLKHIPHKAKLERKDVVVFQQPSRGDNMILSIENQGKPDANEVATHLLGKSIFVAWPHLIEARVCSVSNHEFVLSLGTSGQLNKETHSSVGRNSWSQQVQSIKRQYITKRGVDIGSTSILVHAATLSGIKHLFTNDEVVLQKQWSAKASPYALQTTVKDIKTKDITSEGPKLRTIEELYPCGCTCFLMALPHYGAMGEVKESITDNRTLRLKVVMSVPVEPDLSQLFKVYKSVKAGYMTGGQAAQRLSISPHLLSRITGTVYIVKQPSAASSAKLNLGLNLKFNKRNEEVPGYTRKEESMWLYSQRAIEVVASYIKEFPELFHYLSSNSGCDCFAASDVFPDKDWNYVSEINTWIRNQNCSTVERRPCGSLYLEPEVGEILRCLVDTHHRKNLTRKSVSMHVKPCFLFRSELQSGSLPPDPSASYNLLDRVINVREGFTVPVGLRGTVIGIRQDGEKEADIIYDVMFDEEFPGALSLLCSENCSYSLPTSALINLSHGERQLRDQQMQPLSKPTAVVQPSGGVNMPAPPASTFTPVWKKMSPQSPVRQRQISQPGSAFVSWNAGRGITSPSQNRNQPNHLDLTHEAAVPSPKSGADKNKQLRASTQQTVAGSEFQALWNNLQKLPSNTQGTKTTKEAVTKSLPEVEDPGTELLKKVLRIKVDTNDEKPGQDKQRVPIAAQSNTVAVETQTSPAKRSTKSPIEASSCVRLLHMFQAKGLGIPRYAYIPQEDGTVLASVLMPDNTTFQGVCAANRELASESAAREALSKMDNAGGQSQFLSMSKAPTKPPQLPIQNQLQYQPPGLGFRGKGIGALPPPPQQWFQNTNPPPVRFGQPPMQLQWRMHTNVMEAPDRHRMKEPQGVTPKGPHMSPGWQNQHQAQMNLLHGQGFKPAFGQPIPHPHFQQSLLGCPGGADSKMTNLGLGAAKGTALRQNSQPQFHQNQMGSTATAPRVQGQNPQPFVPLQAAVKSRTITNSSRMSLAQSTQQQEQKPLKSAEASTNTVPQKFPDKSNVDKRKNTTTSKKHGNVNATTSGNSSNSAGPSKPRKPRKVRIAARFTNSLTDLDDNSVAKVKLDVSSTDSKEPEVDLSHDQQN